MDLTAEQRGWGAVGRPGSSTGFKYRHDNIVKITAGGRDLYVHLGVSVIFKTFVDRIVARGYDIAAAADDWGYNHRYIAGTTILSNHSWGLAVDINAKTNPMTHDNVVHTDMPNWVVEEAHKLGLRWGGEYNGAKKDPMHFEFMGTPADAARITQQLTNAVPEEEKMFVAGTPSWAKRQPNGAFPRFMATYEKDNDSTAVASVDNAVFVPPHQVGKHDAVEDFVFSNLWWRRFFGTGTPLDYGEADGSFFLIAENGTYDLSRKV